MVNALRARARIKRALMSGGESLLSRQRHQVRKAHRGKTDAAEDFHRDETRLVRHECAVFSLARRRRHGAVRAARLE